jgi:hypothetical protein
VASYRTDKNSDDLSSNPVLFPLDSMVSLGVRSCPWLPPFQDPRDISGLCWGGMSGLIDILFWKFLGEV